MATPTRLGTEPMNPHPQETTSQQAMRMGRPVSVTGLPIAGMPQSHGPTSSPEALGLKQKVFADAGPPARPKYGFCLQMPMVSAHLVYKSQTARAKLRSLRMGYVSAWAKPQALTVTRARNTAKPVSPSALPLKHEPAPLMAERL